jgi:hypothetical protein
LTLHQQKQAESMLDYLLAGGIFAIAALYLLRYYLPGRKQGACAKCSAGTLKSQ